MRQRFAGWLMVLAHIGMTFEGRSTFFPIPPLPQIVNYPPAMQNSYPFTLTSTPRHLTLASHALLGLNFCLRQTFGHSRTLFLFA